MVFSIAFLFVHSMFFSEFTVNKGALFKKFYFWGFLGRFILLTWLGAKPVEFPYEIFSRYVGVFYFIFGFLLIL